MTEHEQKTMETSTANLDSASAEKHELGDHSESPSPTNPEFPRVDPAAEARLVRKLDLNFLPIITACYLLSYLDRSNIGNAKIAGMSADLHLSADGSQYAWLLTIFYIGYIIFEVCAFMWKVLPPHIWAAFVVTGFGLIATIQSATTNWGGMMVLRFLLGGFEAGYGPGIPYLLSFFYLRRELGLRIGILLSAAPLATCFAGALAYGITSGTHPVIANWRILFLVEGLPSVVMGAVVYFFLPDSPATARFLNDEDKAVAKARAIRQVGAAESSRVGLFTIHWQDIGVALVDPKNYLTAMMYFSCNVAFSSLPVFLPTILTQMNFSPINAQGLSAPPYFISFIVVILSTYIADRYRQRGIVIMVLSLVGGVGYIILAATKATSTRYFGVYLAAIGIFPAIINIIPWTLNNQGSDTKRGAGIAIMNLVGQCGPLLGTRVYPATDSPYYPTGMWTCAAFMLFNFFLALLLRQYLVFENKRLDKKFGNSEEVVDGESFGVENDGPNFRYIL